MQEINNYLITKDSVLAKLIFYFGQSPLIKERREPFDSLARAIISQQLSNSATKSITDRLIKIHGPQPFLASKFIALSDDLLRTCGISLGKIKAIKGVAQATLNGELSINSFNDLSDTETKKMLTSYWGVGPWTAEMFMIFCLHRLDIIALNDAGLKRAHTILYPYAKSLEHTAENWRPFRAYAGSYLWKFLDTPECQEIILG